MSQARITFEIEPGHISPQGGVQAAQAHAREGVESMRVLVCGGRKFEDAFAVFDALNEVEELHYIDVIIAGGARGADALAVEWAERNECPYIVIPARWRKYRNGAGPIRNRLMLRPLGLPLVDLVVAFPGGPGTENMKAQARANGVRVWEYPHTEWCGAVEKKPT